MRNNINERDIEIHTAIEEAVDHIMQWDQHNQFGDALQKLNNASDMETKVKILDGILENYGETYQTFLKKNPFTEDNRLLQVAIYDFLNYISPIKISDIDVAIAYIENWDDENEFSQDIRNIRDTTDKDLQITFLQEIFKFFDKKTFENFIVSNEYIKYKKDLLDKKYSEEIKWVQYALIHELGNVHQSASSKSDRWRFWKNLYDACTTIHSNRVETVDDSNIGLLNDANQVANAFMNSISSIENIEINFNIEEIIFDDVVDRIRASIVMTELVKNAVKAGATEVKISLYTDGNKNIWISAFGNNQLESKNNLAGSGSGGNLMIRYAGVDGYKAPYSVDGGTSVDVMIQGHYRIINIEQ